MTLCKNVMQNLVVYCLVEWYAVQTLHQVVSEEFHVMVLTVWLFQR